MKDYIRGKLGIISCKSGEHFAKKVVFELQKILKEEHKSNEQVIKNSREVVFANSEIKTEINDSIRNQDVYIFQDVENKSLGLSVNDNLMALKTAINAAKLSNAHCITAVIPAYPYARQDKTRGRECLTASMVARELEDAGATRIITLDVHNEAIAGFFRLATLENLRSSGEFISYIKNNFSLKNLVIVTPDAGGALRANFYAKKLEVNLAMIHKERDYSKTNHVEKMSLIGEVKGKDIIIIDDIIDTGGTLVSAAKELKDAGANTIVFAASLCLFNGTAIKRLDEAHSQGILDGVIGTNVIYRDENFKKEHPWYSEVSMEGYFARVIYNINNGLSISKLIE